LPGSSDRNKGPESHSHDIVLTPRLRDLLSDEFPDIIERYEELRALYGVVSQLAAIRRAQGVTQAQLAERLGRPQSLISAIESGRMSPHVETLVALARELGYNIRIELEPRTTMPGDTGNPLTDGTSTTPRPGRVRKSERT
jgi:ribosome-binding protein aMBF1 (putative translation factor)